jgi:predicted RecA/RadA family phage recombinase
MSAPYFEGTTPLIADRYILRFIAGAAIAVGQAVELIAAWTVSPTTSATGSYKLMGVALTNANAGQSVTVICRGLCRVTCWGSVSYGDQLTTAPNGTLQTYTTHDTAAVGNAVTAGTSGGTAYVVLW